MRKHCLSLFALALSFVFASCAVTVPNTRVCAVAGVMAAGADCAYTRSDKMESLTLAELIELLEAGAMIQSAQDWNKNATVIEQLCKMLGPKCNYEEVKKSVNRVNGISANGPR